MIVELCEIAVRRGGHLIVEEVTASLEAGTVVGLVGPNGSGKSTILQTIYRLLAADRGAVLVGGDDTASLSLRESARRIAVVAQESPTDLDLTVHEAVMLGRIPHQRALAANSLGDHQMVTWALETVGISHLADRQWVTLSGGEKQRALVARALAQDCPVMVLDEPTNHLDVHHQLALLGLARRLGRTVLAALHDLNLAGQYCDHVIVLDHGRIVAAGTPDQVFVEEVLTPVFGVHVDRVPHPRTGSTQILFSALDPTATQEGTP